MKNFIFLYKKLTKICFFELSKVEETRQLLQEILRKIILEGFAKARMIFFKKMIS